MHFFETTPIGLNLERFKTVLDFKYIHSFFPGSNDYDLSVLVTLELYLHFHQNII